MSEDQHTPPKRESLLLPILIPIAILAGIVIFALSLGLLYLSMSPEAATLTALGVLVGLVVVTGLVSRAKQGGVGGLVVMGATFFGVALLVGGVSLATFGQPHHEAEGEGHDGPPEVMVNLVATDLAFEPDQLAAPAEPFVLHFDNQDAGTQHNVQIFEGDTADSPVQYDGEVITGPNVIDYHVPGLAPGPHAFDCKIHPAMQGTITIAEGGGGGGGGSAVSETAKDIAFGSGELEVAADTPFTIDFENQESGVPHTIRIYEGESPSDPVHFAGEVVNGGETITYSVDALAPGVYLFDCELHPNMQGTIIVKSGEDAPPGEKPEKPELETPPMPPDHPMPPPDAPAEPPPPTEPTASTSVPIAAKAIAFDTDALSAPADTPFTIEFDNQDSGIPHNIEIFKGSSTSEPLHFDGEIVTGPVQASYEIDALPAGEYLFNCKIHPNMQGTITVS